METARADTGVLERALTELLGQPAPAPAARKRQRTAETKHQPKQWLPSCEREFLCTRCFFTGDSRRWEFDDTKVHQPKDGLRRHVAKVCKEKASETLFSGELISEGGERHFGLCVCSGPCTCGGEGWIRHPDAESWQSKMRERFPAETAVAEPPSPLPPYDESYSVAGSWLYNGII